MADFNKLITSGTVPEILNALTLEPPAWTRLEPQSVTGDPRPGVGSAGARSTLAARPAVAVCGIPWLICWARRLGLETATSSQQFNA